MASAEPQAETIETEYMFDQMQASFRNVAEELSSSLVLILGRTRDGQAGTGSGFIVDYDARNDTFHAATNNHVAGGPAFGTAGPWDLIQVTTHDGRQFEAVLVGADSRYDVALLAFEHSTDDKFDWRPSVSSVGDSDAVQAGHLVYAVGAPSGQFGNYPESVTLGIVSSVWVSIGISCVADVVCWAF